jgi:hypothetical protein
MHLTGDLPSYAVPITPDKLTEAREITLRLGKFHILVDNAVQVLRASIAHSFTSVLVSNIHEG